MQQDKFGDQSANATCPPQLMSSAPVSSECMRDISSSRTNQRGCTFSCNNVARRPIAITSGWLLGISEKRRSRVGHNIGAAPTASLLCVACASTGDSWISGSDDQIERSVDNELWAAAEHEAWLSRASDTDKSTSQHVDAHLRYSHTAVSDITETGLERLNDRIQCDHLLARLQTLENSGFAPNVARRHIEFILRSCYTRTRAQCVASQLQTAGDLSETMAWLDVANYPDLLLFPPESLIPRYQRLQLLASNPAEATIAINGDMDVLTLSIERVSDTLDCLSGLGYTQDEQFVLLCKSACITSPVAETLEREHARLGTIFEADIAEIRSVVLRDPWILRMLEYSTELIAGRVQKWCEDTGQPPHSALDLSLFE